jgi:hypothetical protein
LEQLKVSGTKLKTRLKQCRLNNAKIGSGFIELLLNSAQGHAQGRNALIIVIGGHSSTLDETTVGCDKLVEMTLRELKLLLRTLTFENQIRDNGSMPSAGLHLSALSEFELLLRLSRAPSKSDNCLDALSR